MPPSKVEIRSATTDDVPSSAAVVTAAFLTEPLSRFGCPSPYDYLKVATPAFEDATADSVARGGAFVSADLCATALWFPPETTRESEILDDLIREAVSPDRLDDYLGSFQQMAESHPDEPHWYLHILAVDPHAQGQGLGGALLRHTLHRCDEQGELAYLESANPRNITLYERHGFEQMGRIQVGAAPAVIPMLRQPR